MADAARAADAQTNRRRCSELQKVIELMEKEKKPTVGHYGKEATLKNRSSKGKSRDNLPKHAALGGRDFGDGTGDARGRNIIEARYAGMERDGSQRVEGDGCCQE